MKTYEVFVEVINPCGGDKHSQKKFLEVEAEAPETWVKENAAFPILDVTATKEGEPLIITGDGKGNFVRYTFSG